MNDRDFFITSFWFIFHYNHNLMCNFSLTRSLCVPLLVHKCANNGQFVPSFYCVTLTLQHFYIFYTLFWEFYCSKWMPKKVLEVSADVGQLNISWHLSLCMQQTFVSCLQQKQILDTFPHSLFFPLYLTRTPHADDSWLTFSECLGVPRICLPSSRSQESVCADFGLFCVFSMSTGGNSICLSK